MSRLHLTESCVCKNRASLQWRQWLRLMPHLQPPRLVGPVKSPMVGLIMHGVDGNGQIHHEKGHLSWGLEDTLGLPKAE